MGPEILIGLKLAIGLVGSLGDLFSTSQERELTEEEKAEVQTLLTRLTVAEQARESAMERMRRTD